MNADNELEVRLPVKAGTRLVAAASPIPRRRPSACRGAAGCWAATIANAPGIDMLYISGPFNGKTPGATRRAGSAFSPVSPTAAREEEACARKILTTLARRAYRRPVTDADVQPLARDLQGRPRRRATSRRASSARSRRCCRRRSSCCASSASRPARQRGTAYRLSDLELASRLSFFLWRSMPDDELHRRRRARPAARPGGLRAAGSPACSRDRRATRFMNDFVGQWLEVRNLQAHGSESAVPGLRRHAAQGDGARKPSCSSRARSARIGRCWSCCAPTTRSSTSGWRATTASTTSTAAISGA